MIYCNVTTSIGDRVQWVGVDLISTNCTDINCICAEQKRTVSYEIYSRLINSPDHDSATVAVHSVGLALCNTTVSREPYMCVVQEEGGATISNISIIITFNDTVADKLNAEYWSIILLPIVAMVTVAIVIVMVAIAVMVYRNRKQNSSPMHIPSRRGITSDKKEFPRDQLKFMEVLGKRCGHSLFSYYGDSTGEGQFGQVRKAQAIGIVPHDLTRNIVAVKSLKSMYCSVGQRH